MSQTDGFKATSGVPSYPARKAQAVDLSSTDFSPISVTKAIYVGVAGDVMVIMADDSDAVKLKALPVGFYQLQVKTIVKVGTAATDLVALF